MTDTQSTEVTARVEENFAALEVDGETQTIRAETEEEVRHEVLRRTIAIAERLGRDVSLVATDREGEWHLIVSPEGDVSETAPPSESHGAHGVHEHGSDEAADADAGTDASTETPEPPVALDLIGADTLETPSNGDSEGSGDDGYDDATTLTDQEGFPPMDDEYGDSGADGTQRGADEDSEVNDLTIERPPRRAEPDEESFASYFTGGSADEQIPPPPGIPASPAWSATREGEPTTSADLRTDDPIVDDDLDADDLRLVDEDDDIVDDGLRIPDGSITSDTADVLSAAPAAAGTEDGTDAEIDDSIDEATVLRPRADAEAPRADTEPPRADTGPSGGNDGASDPLPAGVTSFLEAPGDDAAPAASNPLTAPAPAPGDSTRTAPTSDAALPTLADFRAGQPAPVVGPATEGWRGAIRTLTGGVISPAPGAKESRNREAIASITRSLNGPRTICVINPKGGAHKTTATMLIAATFGLHRGGYTLAWDNNETRGTLGWRANPSGHAKTAVDLLEDIDRFSDLRSSRVGDLDGYVRSQAADQFDVLASDEDAAASSMIDADAFNRLHEALERFYRIIVIDTGNNMRASNWEAAIAAADQLVIVSAIREDTAGSAAWMVEGLVRKGHEEKLRNAVTILSAPDKNVDAALRARLVAHFGSLTRDVVEVPYEPSLVSGGGISIEALSPSTRQAWLTATATIANGL